MIKKTPSKEFKGATQKTTTVTLWKPDVEHSAFSDDAYFAAKIPGYGEKSSLKEIVYWFFKKGPYFSKVDTNLAERKVDT